MIIFDDSQFKVVLAKIDSGIDGVAMQAAKDMADTLLILSRYEVPHDEGMLQASGHTAPDKDGWLTVYNSVYAAFQHEGRRKDGTHIIRHHQKGRKGKYLFDPLTQNTARWNEIAAKKMAQFIASGKI